MSVTREEVAGAVARGYCTTANMHKEPDADLVTGITNEVMALLQSISQEAVRDEALEERFWVVEAVNEDDTVLSPPAYWYGGFVGSTVAGHVGSDIHALCTRFQNAQTAEYVKCLLRNAKILPDRGHHWKIFKHVIALKREPNAPALGMEHPNAAGAGPAPAAPDVAEIDRCLKYLSARHFKHDSEISDVLIRCRAALLAKLGQEQPRMKLYQLCEKHKGITSYMVKVSSATFPSETVCPVCEEPAPGASDD